MNEQTAADDDDEIEKILADCELHDFEKTMEDALKDYNSNYDHLLYVTGIRCAPHTIQLVVNDGLKKLDSQHLNVLALAREAAKFLRLKSTLNELTMNNITIRKIHLDTKTRWSSYKVMVGVLKYSLTFMMLFDFFLFYS